MCKETKARTIASTRGCVSQTQKFENNDNDLEDDNDNENNEDETGKVKYSDGDRHKTDSIGC